jgi:glycosyltransferase involved in cell wall biosynthesis
MTYFSRLDTWFSKWCFKIYDYTLVVSEAVKRKYPETGKVIVLYNGLDLEYFKRDNLARLKFRNGLNFNEDDIVFGLAASICPRKGQLQLIEAFSTVSTINTKTKLLIIGNFGDDDAGYNEGVKRAIKACSNVIYLGFTENMVDF